ncbi:tail fiber protein [Salmonella enterica]|nr:tail fiber protein [Salmonella enterica]EDX48507.1 gpS [Salmonella enterica subsp. enterica serovar Newport str. SL317]WQN65921.1 tail fiber protein [Salmonella enterica subsp. enterica serovar Newport str. CFSAN001636]
MSGDSVVISSVAYPDPRKLALVADMQYHEPYTSAALNRKLRGILREGFYTGFIPRPGGGLNLLVTSVDSEQKTGSASINIGDDYQITVRQQKDVILKLSAGTKFAIILKAVYTLGSDTYQVNSKSSIKATEIYAKTFTDSYELGDGELLICTVNIPAGAKEITIDMIDSTAKKVAAIGIELSNDFNSDEEKKAATPKAVKDGIADHEQKADPHSQYAMKESPVLTGIPEAPTASAGSNTNQIANTAFVQAVILGLIGGSPETLSTLKKIADAINNDPNFSTTISNELALKAPLDSPLLTGAPSAPTAPEDTNNTQIATTAFVRRAISALVGSAPETLDTINEIATALGNDPNFATTMLNALGGKQPLDNTLTNLSGKDVAGLLAYLGLGETINLAKNAVPATRRVNSKPLTGDITLWASDVGAISTDAVGEITDNGTMASANTPGWWRVSVSKPDSVADFPTYPDGSKLYSYGYLFVEKIGEVWFQHYYAHMGANAKRQDWRTVPNTSRPWIVDYNTANKPSAGDVGALPITGGRLNGPLGIGTDNALGGNSIVLGDNDTGIKQNGDGVLDIYANSAHVLRFISSLVESMVSLKVNGNAVATGEVQAGNGSSRMTNNGDIFGSVWNGWLSIHLNNNLVADVQLGAGTSVSTWDKAGSWPNTPGYVVTSVWKDANGINIDGIDYAPLQKRVGNQWYTVQGGTA